MTVRMRSFTVPVSCSSLVLPCTGCAVALGASGASAFLAGGALATGGADVVDDGAVWVACAGVVDCVVGAVAAGALDVAAGAGGSVCWASEPMQNKPKIVQDEIAQIKKRLKRDSSSRPATPQTPLPPSYQSRAPDRRIF